MSVSVLAALALLGWAMDPAPGPSVPFWWTAYPEADNAVLVNPAGTAWLNGSSVRIGCIFSDSTFEHFDRVTLDDPSGGFAGWWEDDQSLRRFTASASHSFRSMSAGVGYTWYDPTVEDHPQNGEKFFTLGLNLRPDPHIGLGATARTATGDIDECYITGLALRPLGDHRLTLTGDYRFESGVIPDRWSAGAEARFLDGVAIRASYGDNDSFSAGLQLDFGRTGITAGAEIPDGNYVGSTAEILMFDNPRPSVIEPLPDFLSYSTERADELPSREFLGPRIPSFTEELAALSRGVGDPEVSGVMLDMSDYSLNAAQSEELREILQSYRAAGKPVFAYMESAGNGSYYAASPCEAICMHRAGEVSMSGYSGYTFFLRGFLDKIGVYPDLMHIGDYKNASDMLTEYRISDAQIEAMTTLMETIKAEQIRGISGGRGFEPAQLAGFFENSPISGEALVTTALVDTLLYQDQFQDFVEHAIGRSVDTMSPGFYSSVPREPSRWGCKPAVAVVVATGNIINGESGSGLMGRNMGSDTITEMLEEAASTPGVRAIVLRIDSGGGDALASDDMHHAVQNVRERMPVVVSMGGVAASGGYYMACGADAIFADRMTITGSIGIISGKITYGDMLEKLGINVERVDIEPSGSPRNPYEPYTEEQWEREFASMRQGYELFVNTVARGRDMTFDEVDAIGQGRVWSGKDALELGLVDHNGGVVDAVAHAARIAEIDGDHDLVVFPRVSGLGTLSMSLFQGASVSGALNELAGDPLLNARGPLYMAPWLIVE
ncbi:MAG TPA: signal peptide peptidase SppA [Candidatus Sabulitectum sp.]|nr:signal peptide peptidase SppA [Candidatus Sabulitectum sp.]HPJ28354.1 signal peptide peptidase SppA [Candidatus Sabulitectum sp.]HPR21487.1 signal peptide peptidase SppA [Candidatus Sabulitectum sp.]